MTLRRYLILMLFSTLLCWGAWFLVLWLVNPAGAGKVGFFIFYLALFFALVGTLAILGFVIRYLFKKDEFAFRQVKTSFRQSIMLAILLVGSLMLQAQGLLAWWNLLIFILVLTTLEFFFISQKQIIVGDSRESSDSSDVSS